MSRRSDPQGAMPEPAQRSDREFLPSANQALANLEQATGKPVLIQENQDLKVLATIHRAGAEESCHVLRIKGSSDHISDYLITFECHMALRDGPEPKAVVREKREARERVISEVEKLHRQLPLAKARDLGKFLYNGLIVQLRSTGPGLVVDRWIREHCPDLLEAQARSIETQITENLGVLQAGTSTNFPARVYNASVAMNAAYAVFGGDLLGKPHLGVPYVSQGHGELARRLIATALGDGETTPADRQIIDAWSAELGISSWYDWIERTA